MTKWPRKKYLHLFSALALSFGVLSPLPASASVIENCVGNDCTVTFAFSGEMNTFLPPQNARNMTFEVSGAQGGKSGGGGGQVTGTLLEVPEVLYIFVGGAGKTGNSAPGGFNGGGVAGSGSDMEGSGGGATDIRTGLDLSSRIVVAGGGGARGAGLGSGGGSGGGLVALDGRTAQGFGGTGGSQEAGGVGGAPNGSGSAGLQGFLGVGGTGGSSSLFGGGGGGGGYFGGGGGGSDTDSCCTDAGGGGGGSSYTDANLVSNVVHTQGIWPGSGQVILHYQLAPVVTSISSAVSLNQVSFQIEFDKSVAGFEVSDLEINHSVGSCGGITLSGSEQSYQVILTECADGEVSITVKADSVSSSDTAGPIEGFTSGTVLIDTLAPSANWGQVSFSGAVLEFTEAIVELYLSDIEFSAASETCSLAGIGQSTTTTWQLTTQGCEQSNFTLSIGALSVSDASGNRGPAETISANFLAEVPDPPALAEPEPVQEIAAAPTETVLREEPSETGREIQQPDSSLTIEQPEPVNPEQMDKDSDKAPIQSAPTEANQQVDLSESDSDQDLATPGIFISPPASSLPQAGQTVTIPTQSPGPSFGLNGLTLGLLAIGLFATGAGLVIARRGIPGVLSN